MSATAPTDRTERRLRNGAARLALLLRGNDLNQRVLTLRRLGARLGASGYPTLLQLLATIAESDHDEARRGLADTLAQAVRRDALPMGKVQAWGLRARVEHDGRWNARSLAPIEYLIAWYHQNTGSPRISAESLDRMLAALVSLSSLNSVYARHYCRRLFDAAELSPVGSVNERSRRGLRDVAHAWQQGLSPESVARAARVGRHRSAATDLLVRRL